MNHDPLDYASPQTRSRVKRSPGQWIILLCAWAVGLVVWTVYGAIIVIILLRIL